MSTPITLPAPGAPSRPSRGPGETLVERLRERLAQQTGRPIAMVETHISWVLLTGPYAYKIKKPVALGFLDFSSLELRRRCCDEEVRLNRRLAPELSLGASGVRQPVVRARCLRDVVRLREAARGTPEHRAGDLGRGRAG